MASPAVQQPSAMPPVPAGPEARPAGLGVRGPQPASSRTSDRADTAWMDLARVAGIVAVVVAHVISPAVLVDVKDHGSAAWWAAAGINSVVRFCVPIFILVSGALLLAPRTAAGPSATSPVRDFYRRRLRRVGIPLLAWSVFYLGLRAWTSPQGLTVHKLAEDLAIGKPYYHLYFLFVLAGLYAITPFLRIVVAHAKPRTLATFAGVLLAIGVVDQLLSMLLQTGQSNAATQFLPYAGYFVAGLLLQRMALTRGLVRLASTAFVLGAAFTTVGTWAMLELAPVDYADEYFVMPLSPTVLAMSFGAVVLLRAWVARRPLEGTRGRAIGYLSALSFGVYLVHPAVLTQLRDRVTYPSDLGGVLTTGGAILVATLAVSIVVTAVGRRIPGLRAIF